jgi:hypothetical protein
VEAETLGLSPLDKKVSVMNVQTRQVHIPGVGGPFIETTIDAPFEGASRSIGLELGPGYRPEPSRMAVTSIAFVSFLMGTLTGVVVPLLI